MFDDLEPQKKSTHSIVLGADLSTFSVEDIDELIDKLSLEIDRLKEERSQKTSSLDAAQAFFKS